GASTVPSATATAVRIFLVELIGTCGASASCERLLAPSMMCPYICHVPVCSVNAWADSIKHRLGSGTGVMRDASPNARRWQRLSSSPPPRGAWPLHQKVHRHP